jgi:hypothetical protein
VLILESNLARESVLWESKPVNYNEPRPHEDGGELKV